MDWKSIVSTVAPVLGLALGGPLGGMAAKAISGALLGKEDASDAEIARAISGASPDQLMKLKSAEGQFATRMKELDIDLERINAEDRDSARKRQVETGDNTPTILAMMLSAAFFGLLGSMMFFEIPDSNRDLLNIMVGVLGAAWTAAMSYYFGSSQGSAKKNALLARK